MQLVDDCEDCDFAFLLQELQSAFWQWGVKVQFGPMEVSELHKASALCNGAKAFQEEYKKLGQRKAWPNCS